MGKTENQLRGADCRLESRRQANGEKTGGGNTVSRLDLDTHLHQRPGRDLPLWFFCGSRLTARLRLCSWIERPGGDGFLSSKTEKGDWIKPVSAMGLLELPGRVDGREKGACGLAGWWIEFLRQERTGILRARAVQRGWDGSGGVEGEV